MSEANVNLMKRWFKEVWEERRAETIAELFAPDATAYGTSDAGGEIRGPEEFRVFYERLIGSFSDMKFIIEDTLDVNDKVVLRWTATMRHTGDKLGLRPSGKTIRITGVTIARVVNGQIIEGWDNWDKLGMLQQIGALQLAASGAA
jgi:steroid delta-isomerase-like uncharacterized protein